MRLTSTCCVRSGVVCQADAIVQGAELGQRQRTAAIRTARAPTPKSLRIGRTPLGDNSLYQCLSAAYRYLRPVSRFSSRFGSLNSTDTRHSPVLDGCILYGLQSSLHDLSRQAQVKQRPDCVRGRLASPRSRHNTFNIHSVSTPASSSWASTSGQKRRMYVSSLPRRC